MHLYIYTYIDHIYIGRTYSHGVFTDTGMGTKCNDCDSVGVQEESVLVLLVWIVQKNIMFLCLCGWIVQDSVLVFVCVCVFGKCKEQSDSAEYISGKVCAWG